MRRLFKDFDFGTAIVAGFGLSILIAGLGILVAQVYNPLGIALIIVAVVLFWAPIVACVAEGIDIVHRWYKNPPSSDEALDRFHNYWVRTGSYVPKDQRPKPHDPDEWKQKAKEFVPKEGKRYIRATMPSTSSDAS